VSDEGLLRPPGAAGGGPPPSLAGAPPPEGGLEHAFLTVWLHPRATIRRIVTVDPSYGVVPLAAIGGITQVLASMSRRPGADTSLANLLLGAVVGGPVFGIFALYAGAWLTRLTGRWWLHGQGSPAELRAAFGWASLAQVVMLPLWLLATAAFGLSLYTESGSDLAARSPVYALFAGAVVVLQIWGVVIVSAGIAEVQGYRSGWKGFWNLVLVLLLVVGAAVVVSVVIVGLAALAGGLLRR